MPEFELKKSDLLFDYPETLVAIEKKCPSRVMWVSQNSPEEITVSQLLNKLKSNDVLVINNTKVLARRVFTKDQIEILFLNTKDQFQWEVLFPSKKFKEGHRFELPEGQGLTFLKKGRPQIVRTDNPLDEAYFERCGELPLPPYIQKARAERHNRKGDTNDYQTAWAQVPGSFAAPTASLHFTSEDLSILKDRGVKILEITLHVGLGTFLPVENENLTEHKMHAEWVSIPEKVVLEIQKAKSSGGLVWALGTTVTRALESIDSGYFQLDAHGNYQGSTDILILPGFQFKVVDRLMTNFHQPESTLLALVYAFSGKDLVQRCYQWAIERKFRLFSYGDLSVWSK